MSPTNAAARAESLEAQARAVESMTEGELREELRKNDEELHAINEILAVRQRLTRATQHRGRILDALARAKAVNK